MDYNWKTCTAEPSSKLLNTGQYSRSVGWITRKHQIAHHMVVRDRARSTHQTFTQLMCVMQEIYSIFIIFGSEVFKCHGKLMATISDIITRGISPVKTEVKNCPYAIVFPRENSGYPFTPNKTIDACRRDCCWVSLTANSENKKDRRKFLPRIVAQ